MRIVEVHKICLKVSSESSGLFIWFPPPLRAKEVSGWAIKTNSRIKRKWSTTQHCTDFVHQWPAFSMAWLVSKVFPFLLLPTHKSWHTVSVLPVCFALDTLQIPEVINMHAGRMLFYYWSLWLYRNRQNLKLVFQVSLLLQLKLFFRMYILFTGLVRNLINQISNFHVQDLSLSD